MCGIAGFFSTTGSRNRGELHQLVERMTSTMIHRGPDASGIWICPRSRVALGHRRLSIIDTSEAGTQPMISGDGRYVISFNGEIYNFLELRPILESKGCVFRTRTDTEVLIEAMRVWGPEGLLQLDGMFAFALHDTVTGETLLGRDAFGEKPLYYVSNGERFAFASELQALQTLPDFDFSVSTDAVAEYLCFQYIGAPRTLYCDARKLPPGHFMRVSTDGRMQLQRYFEFRPASSESTESRPVTELAEECEEILVRSLRRRLISDVPLGAFLSGGVDSSTVVALVTRVLGRNMKTFSIGFEDSQDSEHDVAREFARHLGTEHREEIFQPNQAGMAEQIGRMLDEPNGDTSCAPTWLLCGMARKHVTVAISGDGGDELFLGYRRHLQMIEERRLFESNQQLGWTLGSGYYSEQILVNTETDLRRLFGYIPEPLRLRLLHLREKLDGQSKRAMDVLRQTDVENYMPGAVLAKVDRMSMQHSLEVRTPFLSIELARFAERLPPDALCRDGVGKVILRRIAKKYLPAHLVDLPKKGFGLPMTGWARESLMPHFEKQFREESSPLAKIIPETAVERFMQRQTGAFAPYQIWALSVLGHYCTSHPIRFTAKPPAVHELARRGTDFMALPLLAELRRRAQPVLLLCVDELPAWFAALPAGSVIVSRWKGQAPESLPLRYFQCAWEDAGALAGLLRSNKLERPLGAGVVYCGSEAGKGGATSQMASLIHVSESLSPTIDFWCYYLPDSYSIRCQRFSAQPSTADPLQPSAFWHFTDSLSRRIFLFFQGGARRASRRMVRRGGHLLLAWKFSKLTDRVFVYGEELPKEIRTDNLALVEGRRPIKRASSNVEHRIAEILAGNGNNASAASLGKLVAETTWTVLNNRIVIATSDPLSIEHGLHEYHLERSQSLTSRLFFKRHRWIVRDSQHRPPSGEGAAQWKLFEAAFSDFIRLDNEVRSSPDHAVPRRVIMVTWALAPGGAERQFAISARHLRGKGEDVSTYSLMPLTGHLAHYLPVLQRGNVPMETVTSQCETFSFDTTVENTPWQRAVVRALSLLPDDIYGHVWNLYTHFVVHRPQAVYSQLDWPSICVAIAGLLAGVPRSVVSFRGMSPERTPHHGTAMGWHRRSFLMLRKSHRVALSGNSKAGNDDYAHWLGILPSEVILVRNGLETDSLDEATRPGICQGLREQLGLRPHEAVLLGVFRLDPEKRPALFVELASQLLDKLPDLVVLHAGGGSTQEAMQEQLAGRGHSRRFRLLGRRPDTYALIKLASVVCLTSEFEGTPNVLLEAQYLGTPVVAFSVGGVPESVAAGKSGFLVKDGDNSGWMDACMCLLTDESLRQQMGAAGRIFVSESYGIDNSCKKLLATMGIA